MRPIRLTLAGAALGLTLAWPAAAAYTASTGASSAGTARIVAAAPAGPPSGSRGPTQAAVVGTGPAVPNPYGAVQVEVTLTGTTITDVQAVQLPSGGRSGQISRYAGPQLAQEALTAQTAQVDTVSGASYTSAGYRTSLQAALDVARAAVAGSPTRASG